MTDYPTCPWVNGWPEPTYHPFIIGYLKSLCQAGWTPIDVPLKWLLTLVVQWKINETSIFDFTSNVVSSDKRGVFTLRFEEPPSPCKILPYISYTALILCGKTPCLHLLSSFYFKQRRGFSAASWLEGCMESSLRLPAKWSIAVDHVDKGREVVRYLCRDCTTPMWG